MFAVCLGRQVINYQVLSKSSGFIQQKESGHYPQCLCAVMVPVRKVHDCRVRYKRVGSEPQALLGKLLRSFSIIRSLSWVIQPEGGDRN